MNYKNLLTLLEDVGETIGLLDLYEPDELYDTSEVLHDWVDRAMEDFEFPVHVMEPDQLTQLQTAFGEDTVIDAYNEHAAASQKRIVKDKMKKIMGSGVNEIIHRVHSGSIHHRQPELRKMVR